MELRNITYEMDARGYAEEDIKRVLGGNMMRVFEKTFKE
jgi:microsomal dipeptidase-like Zn-dependent dipeptidase